MSPGGCKKGANCNFLHPAQGASTQPNGGGGAPGTGGGGGSFGPN